MGVSDAVAVMALLVSIFSFYWTGVKEVKRLYLVRADGFSQGGDISYVLLNGGTKDILVSSVICAYEAGDGTGWIAPDRESINGANAPFVLKAGESKHCTQGRSKKAVEELITNGHPRVNEERNTYDFDVKIVIEWFDSSAKQHSAEAKIARVGFIRNSGGHITAPLEKTHELYSVSS